MKVFRHIALEIICLPLLMLFIIFTPILLLGIVSLNAELRKNDKKIRSLLNEERSLMPLLRYAENLGIKFQKNKYGEKTKEAVWLAVYPGYQRSPELLLTKYLWIFNRFDETGKQPIIQIALSKDGKTIKPEPEYLRKFFLAHEIGHLENAKENRNGLPDCPKGAKHKVCAKSEILATVKGLNILKKLEYSENDPVFSAPVWLLVLQEAHRSPGCLNDPACQAELNNLSVIEMDALRVTIDVEKLLWTRKQ